LPVDPSQLEKALVKIRAEYGEGGIHMGEDKSPIARIPTGAIELDMVTGGGIPIGRMSHFYGGFSSAKTMTCWNVIREAQKMGMTCAYYNLEKQYEKELLIRRGLDVKNLLVVEGTTIEETGTKVEALLPSVHVHVIDSLACGVSIDELNGNVEDWHMGLQARAWAKVLRRVNERFDDTQNCLIMVNQVRDVFSRGGGEAPPGGRLIEYLSSMSLYFRRSSWLYRNDDGILDSDNKQTKNISGDTTPEGIEFQIRVQKSRVCQPLRSARLRLDFSTIEFDELWALQKAAGYYGVVDGGKGGRYTLPDGTKLHGRMALRNAIAADSELAGRIREAMLAAA
jgi:recombination protein RecA